MNDIAERKALSHAPFVSGRVYSYTRFSTPEQAQGDSARRQMDAARHWAADNGMVLDERLSIADLGVSAFRGSNLDPEAGLGRFVEAVNAGLVEPGSILLIESLDRLSRMEPLMAQHLFSGLVLRGVSIVTLGDGQRYDKDRLAKEPWALLGALSVAIRAHEESVTKSKRIGSAWAEKRKRLREGAPGRLTLKAPAWLRWDGKQWVEDRAKADIVRRIFKLTLDGHGERKIAIILNEHNVPRLGQRGSYWQRVAIAKILNNRAVLGELTPGHMEERDGKRVRVAEEPIPGAFPAIISEADWVAVRAMKDGHAPARRGRGADKPLANVFSTLARCGRCGSPMTRISKGQGPKTGKPGLLCTKAKAGDGCTYRRVRLDPLHEAFFRHAATLIEDVPAGEKSETLDEQIESLKAVYMGKDAHYQELAEALEAAPSRAGAERLAKLEAEIETLRAAIADAEEQRRCMDGGLIHDRAVRLAAMVDEYKEGEPLEPINAALRTLFESITVDYDAQRLLFSWRQGGESVIPYAYGFVNETVGT